jgi:hypothetical protein
MMASGQSLRMQVRCGETSGHRSGKVLLIYRWARRHRGPSGGTKSPKKEASHLNMVSIFKKSLRVLSRVRVIGNDSPYDLPARYFVYRLISGLFTSAEISSSTKSGQNLGKLPIIGRKINICNDSQVIERSQNNLADRVGTRLTTNRGATEDSWQHTGCIMYERHVVRLHKCAL